MLWPKITIITPNYNQDKFLERTIQSVLDQQYPNLEYIIIDGGSTDKSLDIIKTYEPHLAAWISEPDRGQAHAINKGLKTSSGDWVGWQNSDDIYYEGAFEELAKATLCSNGVDLLIGDIMLINAQDQILRDVRYVKPTYRSLLAEGMVIASQSAFWRRSVHTEIGYLDERYHCSFDYEWFLRLLRKSRGRHINKCLGGFRLHNQTKTSTISSRFSTENEIITNNRRMKSFNIYAYQLRRLALLGLNGHFRYIFRGILKRLSNREAIA